MNPQKKYLIIFCFISSFSLTGCMNTSYTTTDYAYLNKKEAIENDYQSKRPFRMIPTATHAPLLSSGKQVNFEVDYSQGFSSNLSIGLSKKAFMYFQYDDQSQTINVDPVSIRMRLIRTEKYYNDHSTISIDTSYLNTMVQPYDKIKQTLFTLGGGVYLVKKHNLRIDIIGSASSFVGENNYNYDITSPIVPSMTSTFSEERKGWIGSLQGDVGFVGKNFEAAFTSRFAYINFSEQNFKTPVNVDTYNMRKGLLLYEPAVKLGVGGKVARIFLQYNFSVPIAAGDVTWTPSRVEAGIIFRFADVTNAD